MHRGMTRVHSGKMITQQGVGGGRGSEVPRDTYGTGKLVDAFFMPLEAKEKDIKKGEE